MVAILLARYLIMGLLIAEHAMIAMIKPVSKVEESYE
jgi:hypothetical protein